MSDKQMMAACPKYEADAHGCGKCPCSKQHPRRQICAWHDDRCPACTPLPVEPCPECRGDGEFDGTPPVPCPTCTVVFPAEPEKSAESWYEAAGELIEQRCAEPEQAGTWADDEPRNVRAEPEQPRPTTRERIECKKCDTCGGIGAHPACTPDSPHPTARERIEAELGYEIDEREQWAEFHGLPAIAAAERVIDQDARVIDGLQGTISKLGANAAQSEQSRQDAEKQVEIQAEALKVAREDIKRLSRGLRATEQTAAWSGAEITRIALARDIAETRGAALEAENERLKSSGGMVIHSVQTLPVSPERLKELVAAESRVAALEAENASLTKRCEGCDDAAFKLAFENKSEHEYRERLEAMLRQCMPQIFAAALLAKGGETVDAVALSAQVIGAVDEFMAKRKAPMTSNDLRAEPTGNLRRLPASAPTVGEARKDFEGVLNARTSKDGSGNVRWCDEPRSDSRLQGTRSDIMP